jgi:hypothetical protein
LASRVSTDSTGSCFNTSQTTEKVKWFLMNASPHHFQTENTEMLEKNQRCKDAGNTELYKH